MAFFVSLVRTSTGTETVMASPYLRNLKTICITLINFLYIFSIPATPTIETIYTRLIIEIELGHDGWCTTRWAVNPLDLLNNVFISTSALTKSKVKIKIA